MLGQYLNISQRHLSLPKSVFHQNCLNVTREKNILYTMTVKIVSSGQKSFKVGLLSIIKECQNQTLVALVIKNILR